MTIFTGTTRKDHFNLPLYGLRGAYTLSEGTSLPYFLCSMQIQRVIGELKTAEQIPPSLDNEWNLDELFQREVDSKRVQKDMVRGYLADPKKLKFFNAITVVLMPKDPYGQKLLESFNPYSDPYPTVPYTETAEDDRSWAREDARRAEFGGVQYLSIGDNARLRWDANCVHPIVVDGQHRLVALREWHDRICGNAMPKQAQQTTVPVIFLLLAHEAGFASGGSKRSIRQLSRELFTDLNKNAKKVDKARELILDDYSIVARCTRTLVTKEASKDSKAELPLALVRWKDAINRFDGLYYLNSLTHLESLVSTIVPNSEPKDPLDAGYVRDFIHELNGKLLRDGQELEVDGVSLERVYERDFCDISQVAQIPFSRLPSGYLDAAIAAFEQNHKPWLVRILTEPKPYSAVLDYARNNNLIEGEFGKFFAQTEAHKKSIKESRNGENADWYAKSIDDHVEHIVNLKGGSEAEGDNSDWCYKTIFQKALVRLALDVEFTYRNLNKLGSLSDLINLVNALYDRNLLRVGAPLPEDRFSLWNFVATNPVGGRIKVAKNTEDRILALLRLWHYANRARLEDPKFDSLTDRQKLNYFASEEKTAIWPGCKEAYEILFRAHDVRNFLASDRDQSDEKKRHEAIKVRMSNLLCIGLLNREHSK